MAREIRTSSRLDTTLLDRGLAASAEAGETYIKQADAVANRVTAEGRGIENLGLAKRNFWTSYGSGVRIGLIASGAGLGSLLLLYGVSLVVDAFRRPYSSSAYTALLGQNESLSAQLAQVDKLLQEERSKPQSNINPVGNTDTKAADPAPTSPTEAKGIANGAVLFDPAVADCPSNISYSQKCVGSHQYTNGQSYQGEWRNGLPEGRGSLKLVDGSEIDGVWSAGLPESVNLPSGNVKPLKTVTVFMTQKGSSISPTIQQIVAGHEFVDGNSEMWKKAFCYADIVGSDGLARMVNLSRYPSDNSALVKDEYQSSYAGLITREGFEKAQNECQYQRSGFK